MLSEFSGSGGPIDLLRQFRSVRLAQARLWRRWAEAGVMRRAPAAAAPAPLALGAGVEIGAANLRFVADGAVEDSIWWGRERLRSEDTGLGPCPEVIDVTGPKRCLVFGPHLPLEPGLWRATAIFELCPEAARRRLDVQFGCYPDFTTVPVPIGKPGLHQIDLDYAFRDGQVGEVRLLLLRAGFHGELRFSGAALRRIDA